MGHNLTIRDITLDIPADDKESYLNGELDYCKAETDKFWEAVEWEDETAIQLWREKTLDKRLEYYNNYKEKQNDNKSTKSD